MEEIKSQYYYKYDVVHVCKRGPITNFLTKLEWSIIDNMEEYINNMQYALSDLTVYVGRWVDGHYYKLQTLSFIIP